MRYCEMLLGSGSSGSSLLLLICYAVVSPVLAVVLEQMDIGLGVPNTK